MSHHHRIATLIVGLIALTSFAMAQGAAMLVCAEAAKVVIDGAKEVTLKPYVPEKVELAAGSHEAVATSADDVQTGLRFDIVDGEQHLVQLDFTEARAERDRIAALPKPISIANTELVVPKSTPFRSGSPRTFMQASEVYQAFVEGDEIEIEAEVKGGGNFFIQLIKYPEWKSAGILEDQDRVEGSFDIDETGVYIIRTGSRSLTDERASLKVTRIPANKSVEEVDTRVSLYVQFEVAELIAPKVIYVSAKSQRDNRKRVELDLGNSLFEWYYTFSVQSEEADAKLDLKNHSLLDDLESTVGRLKAIKAEQVEGLEIGMQAIDHPSGNLVADAYLMTPENARKFSDEELFVYILNESVPDATDGEVKVKCCTQGEYVLGFRNMDVYQGVYIALQAVGLRKGLYLARDEAVGN